MAVADTKTESAHETAAGQASGDAEDGRDEDTDDGKEQEQEDKVTQTTGISKHVVFRFEAISDNGEVRLRGVFDRNNIPLDPAAARAEQEIAAIKGYKKAEAQPEDKSPKAMLVAAMSAVKQELLAKAQT